MRNRNTLRIALCGLMVAVVYLATLINIRLPFASQGGLVHLGGVMVVISAYVMRPADSAVSMGLGMGLFDLSGGWTPWAPFTFVIRFVQTYALSHFLGKGRREMEVLGLAVASLLEMAGYYLAEAFLYGSWIVPFASMPGELLLNGVGIAIGVPVARTLIRCGLSFRES